MELNVAQFIQALRESDPNIHGVFTQGSCYRFSKLLVKMFGGRVVVNADVNHAATEINGIIYDVTGIAKDEGWKTPDDFELIEMEKWSFSNMMMFQIGECPACEEPIVC